MLHRQALASLALLTIVAACANDATGARRYDVTPGPGDDTVAGGDVDIPGADTTAGDSATPTPFAPPVGPYVIVSPVAESPTTESDHLVTSGAFAAEVRVGHTGNVRALGFVLHWDPTVLALTSHALVDAWLRSNGGAALTGMDRWDPATGTLAVALAAGGSDAAVSATTSEPVLHLEVAWVGVPTATIIHVDLSPSHTGILEDTSALPRAGVTAVDLTVTPGP